MLKLPWQGKGKEGAETMGKPRNEAEGLMRYRVHPATVAPMPPYWWKSESQSLRSKAEARRQGMSVGQRHLWAQLSEDQRGTKCLRGVVVSGHVVDFFIPEARLIIDRGPAPKFLGHRLAWMTVEAARLAHDVAGVVRDIQEQVTERAGVVPYGPNTTVEQPPMPAPHSPQWRQMIEVACGR